MAPAARATETRPPPTEAASASNPRSPSGNQSRTANNSANSAGGTCGRRARTACTWTVQTNYKVADSHHLRGGSHHLGRPKRVRNSRKGLGLPLFRQPCSAQAAETYAELAKNAAHTESWPGNIGRTGAKFRSQSTDLHAQYRAGIARDRPNMWSKPSHA